jgi:hypothetical protein
MKTIKAKDLKIGDKIFDIPPGDIDRLQFEVIGMDENDIHLKPLSTNSTKQVSISSSICLRLANYQNPLQIT